MNSRRKSHPEGTLKAPTRLCPPCGVKTFLEGENSSSICYVTFLVYLLAMASQTGCEIMNSEVAGSILAVLPVKRRKKLGFSHVIFKDV